jgi:predicted transporter
LIVPLIFVIKLPAPCCWNAALSKVPEMVSEELLVSSTNVFSSPRAVVETRQHIIARSAGKLKKGPEHLQQVEFMLVVGLVLALVIAW